MHRFFGWLRLMATFGMILGTVVATRSGCRGRVRNPLAQPLPQRSLPWAARHLEKVDEVRARSDAIDLLFVGDSITQNYEQPTPADFRPLWEQFFAPHRALNLGFNADGTQHVLWRLEHGEADNIAPANIVLLIGTNNTWHDQGSGPADVAEGIEAVVASLHQRMPAAKILVLAILPSAVTPQKTARDEAINQTVAAFFRSSRFVRTLDLKPLFLNRDGTLDTSLFYDASLDPELPLVHPGFEGQRRMAQAVAETLYPR